jgi:transcription initiation factor TFIID subunit 12
MNDVYHIPAALSTTNPGPVQWASAQQGRPTLTGGIAGGRASGTPAQIARGSDDIGMLNLDDNRVRRKNTPGDQSMRRSIQDLVSSVDPNVKIEPEVEDLLLSIADEFIDSVTNFGCRLAKHRGGDTLEVRDLQLHLERNHNIRIPGFASDETRLSLSQSTVAPAVPPTTGKKSTQGTQMTLRSHRLAQVQQAKREAKLI